MLTRCCEWDWLDGNPVLRGFGMSQKAKTAGFIQGTSGLPW
jgi:hypothetical protein